MQRTLCVVSFLFVTAFTSVSAQAACGGGGFKGKTVKVGDVQVVSVKPVTASGQTVQSAQSRTVVVHNPKLDGAQRDIDKAQAKLDRCVGDCEKERRKLEEAKAKYAKKASEV